MSALYPLGVQAIGTAYLAGPAPTNLTLYAIGVTSAYVYDAAHADLTDVAAESICMEATEITNPTVLATGALDGDDVRFIRPTAGNETTALIVYADHDDGSQLLAYITAGESGTIPLLLVGTDVIIRWAAQGIFKL